MIAPEEIRHRDDKHDSKCAFGCNVRWSSCQNHPASRVNKARMDRECVFNYFFSVFLSLSLSLSFSFSIGSPTYTRVCIRTYVALRTYGRLRTAVYTGELFTIGWQPDDSFRTYTPRCRRRAIGHSQQPVCGWQQRGDSYPVILIRKLRPDSAEIYLGIRSDCQEEVLFCHFEIGDNACGNRRINDVRSKELVRNFKEVIRHCSTLLPRFPIDGYRKNEASLLVKMYKGIDMTICPEFFGI